ncbi:MAG: oligosaccharide flippase family protein [Elusimicrobia bacterium]|nr:oligosaccharide flippase family protein [Elusimicrobiota bacterium]
MEKPLNAEQVVVLSSIDWDTAWQRHQIFAAAFAAEGREVFFVENTGFRNPSWRDLPRLWRRLRNLAFPGAVAGSNGGPEGVRILPPRVLPPTWVVFRLLNSLIFLPALRRKLARAGLRPGAACVVYVPTATTIELVRTLSPRVVLYDCASNFRAHPRAPADFPARERELLSLSDQVVCDSDFLFEQKKTEHPRVEKIHQGVPEEYFHLPPPRGIWSDFCYYGTWSRDFDAGFVDALAAAGFQTTVRGFSKPGAPSLGPAVRRHPPVAREDVAAGLALYDGFLLPYRLNPFLMGVVPAKIYECLATGRPVLAAPLPSLKALEGLVYIGETPEDWVRIARELPRTETDELRRARVALARAHSTEIEFGRLKACLAAAPARKPAASEPPRAGLYAFLSGLGWIGLLYGLAKASTLLTQIAAGRWLGPEEYGRANLVLAAAAYLQIAPMLGFPTAMGKLLAPEQDEARRARFISTALAAFAAWTLLCLPVMAAAHHALGRALGLPDSLFVPSLLLATANAVYVVVASPLLGLRRFAHRGLVEAAYGLSAPFALLAAVLVLGPDHRALISALCAGFLLASLFALWCQRSYLALAFEPRILKAVWGYAAVAALNLLAAAFVLAPARFILHACRGAEEVGLFSAYFTATVQLALALLYMLQAVIIPMASDARGQRETWDMLRRWSAPALLGAWTFFLAGLLAALALFGRRYPMRWDWILAFSGAAVLALAHGTLSALYSARDFSGLRVSVIGGLLTGLGNAALAAWLIPAYGVTGAAAALGLSFALGLTFFLGARAGAGSGA